MKALAKTKDGVLAEGSLLAKGAEAKNEESKSFSPALL